MPPRPGDIWTHERCVFDKATQSWHRKHMLIIDVDKYDVTYRVFTSQDAGRSKRPPCAYPPQATWPAYFIGQNVVPLLHKETWVDLTLYDDEDLAFLENLNRLGVFKFADKLPKPVFCEVLKCAASLSLTDTTDAQRRKMLAVRSSLGCP